MNNLVYWEKQGYDQLCGVHCINSILQGPFFNEIDLATIAQEIDSQERELLGQTENNFKNSNNVAEDGNFSIQVLQEAFKKHGQLHIDSVDSKLNQNSDLSTEDGFICNSASHWFGIRRINQIWYNLNSTNKHGPEIISDFYLSAFLMSVRENGYHIFVVKGIFPDNSIFNNLELNKNQKYYEAQKVKSTHERRIKKKNYQLNIGGSDEADLQKAMKASLGQKQQPEENSSDTDGDGAQNSQQQQQKQQQQFTGQGFQITGQNNVSNYEKFNIDPQDAEYYMTIIMTLESNFQKQEEEGLCILFQLPEGNLLTWTFKYDSTVEDLYDFVFFNIRDKKYKFVLSCPVQRLDLNDVYQQIIDLGIDTMTQIVVRRL